MAGQLNLRTVKLGDNVDTSKNFLITTPAVADGTLTITRENGTAIANIDAAGKVTFPGNVVPAFSVYQNTLQTTTNSAFNKVALQAIEFSIGGYFDNTNPFYRFTPGVAGYYQINGSVGFAASAASLITSIFKNGSEYKRGTQSGSVAGTGAEATVSTLVYLNGSTDYIEMFCYQVSGGALNTVATVSGTWLNGYLARAL